LSALGVSYHRSGHGHQRISLAERYSHQHTRVRQGSLVAGVVPSRGCQPRFAPRADCRGDTQTRGIGIDRHRRRSTAGRSISYSCSCSPPIRLGSSSRRSPRLRASSEIPHVCATCAPPAPAAVFMTQWPRSKALFGSRRLCFSDAVEPGALFDLYSGALDHLGPFGDLCFHERVDLRKRHVPWAPTIQTTCSIRSRARRPRRRSAIRASVTIASWR
jgi:hypothetical protein